MTTTDSIAAPASPASAPSQTDTETALRFITCGSVDDGKSTLIGRLLWDTKPVKDALHALGGRFNARLTHDGQKRAGWIFQKTKEDKVRRLLGKDE